MRYLTPLMLLALPLAEHTVAVDDDPPVSIELFDFIRADAADDWRPVHDGVMGGVSTGGAEWSDGAVRFRGDVSLENNGGFASFRMRPSTTDLSAFDGLRLEVLGRGENWRVSLRTADGRNDLEWQVPFTPPANAWATIELPFSLFEPVHHGRFVAEADRLNREAIVSIGLTVADGQEGPYDLELRGLEAWRVPEGESEPGTVAATVAPTRTLGDLIGLDVEGAELLYTFRGDQRLLVVAEPLVRDDLGAAASMQLGRMIAELDGCAARDLRLVHLLGERGTRLAGRTLGSETTAELRGLWELPAERWTAALVGLDGQVAKRWSEPVTADVVFEAIDGATAR